MARKPPSPKLPDQLPPHDLPSEIGIIGILLTCGELADEVIGKIPSADWFYDVRTKTVFNAVTKMRKHKMRVDTMTVMAALKRIGKLDEIGGYNWLFECGNSFPTSAHLEYYLDDLAMKWRDREVLKLCARTSEQIMNCGLLTTMETIERFKRDASEIPLHVNGNTRTLKDAVLDLQTMLESRIGSNGKLLGLPTGFERLDLATNGMKANELWVVAARPSCGKTAWLCTVAIHLAINLGIPVMFFSHEMSIDQIVFRMASMVSGVSMARSVAGCLDQDEINAMANAMSKLAASRTLRLIEAGGWTVQRMAAEIQAFKELDGIQAAFVDYIQIVAPDNPRENRNNQVGQVTRGLKIMAGEFRMPVITAAQINRDSDRENRAPRMSDLRESGNIECDADSIFILHSTKDDNEDARVIRTKCIIAKQRNGPKKTLSLMFDKERTMFFNPVGAEPDEPKETEDRKMPYKD